ncbi:MAG: response regulator [Desulfobacterales bacterium]|nr:response regulator [Desulfobacterales bacterium]
MSSIIKQKKFYRIIIVEILFILTINTGSIFIVFLSPEKTIHVIISLVIFFNVAILLLTVRKYRLNVIDDFKKIKKMHSSEINKYKEDEKLNRKSEKKYRRLVEQAINYFNFSHNNEGIYTYISPSINNTLGYTQEEFLYHYSKYFTDNNVNQKAQYFKDLSIKGDMQSAYEIEIYNKKKEICTLEVIEHPVFHNDNVIAVEGIIIDKTINKEKEKEMIKWGQALENIESGVMVSSSDETMDIINPTFAKMHGYLTKELAGYPIQKIIAADYRESISKHIKIAHIKGHHVFEIDHLRKDGSTFSVLENITSVKDEVENISYMVVNILDITERNVVEEELKKYRNNLEEIVLERTKELIIAKNSAETANKAKSNFLANMSHEIRTPMNSIMGYAQLMKHDSTLSEEQKENLYFINQSSKHLLAIINDVLEMARIDTRKLKLLYEDFNINSLLQDIKETFLVKARAKNLDFTIENKCTKSNICSDREKIYRILFNLVDNALKFTAKGRITVRLKITGDTNLTLEIEVEDSGIGISEEHKEYIFQSFEQVASIDLTEGSTGLGLSICLGYAKLMKGDITIKSDLDKGSVFCFKTPVLEGNEVHSDILVERKITGLAKGQKIPYILIVDDKKNNRLLLKKQLSSVGLNQLLFAENGREALEVFDAHQIDLILMDMKMPVMNGYEAITRIREAKNESNPVIIAITGKALKKDIEKILKTGANTLICKPFRKNELLHCIKQQLRLDFIFKNEALTEKQNFHELNSVPISKLPLAIREDLAKAALMGEVDSCLDVITKIKDIDVLLADSMAQMIKDFKFDKIYELTRGNL